jgi:signal transduction histidine kinase
MTFLQVIKLFGFAIGVVLQLSLFVLIRRYRRIEKLEILFLGLITALFLWNACRFLSLVFEITKFNPLNKILLQLGGDLLDLPSFFVLAFLPSLLLHAHLVFQQRFTKQRSSRLHPFWEVAVYLPLLPLPAAARDFITTHDPDESILAATAYAQPFAAWFVLSLAISALIDWRMLLESQSAQLRNLFRTLIIIFLSIAGLISWVYFLSDFQTALTKGGGLEALLMLWSTVPCALLGYYIFQYNFLEIAIQRSFGYTFAGVLLLLVYLLCVNGLKTFVETQYGFPGVVVEEGLILALLGFAQPIKRWIDRSVNALFSLEVTKFEGIASRLDNVSRSTVEMEKLLRYVEELLIKELDLKVAKIVLSSQPEESQPLDLSPSSGEAFESVGLSTGKETLGEIRVQSRSGKISTEQQAALRFLVTQIVAAIENCRLTEGKIRLERDLKDQEKMAELGRIIAAVAHNVKNPLSSIKTIVQLMLEDREFTQKYDRDLNLISGEIDRLTHRVEDVLQFRTVLPVIVDLAELLEKMVLLFRPETERRGIRLELDLGSRPLTVRGTEEVFSEVFQNFIVNAWDVAPEKSRIGIRAGVLSKGQEKMVSVRIEDEGPGIPPRIRQQIFDPFFSTKPKGAGLGLHVVQRRIMDLGGEVDCVSPVANGRGTGFEVVLPFENTGGIQETPR